MSPPRFTDDPRISHWTAGSSADRHDQNESRPHGLFRRKRPLQGTNEGPLEKTVPDLVIFLEVVDDLSSLERSVHDLPPLSSVGIRQTASLFYRRLHGFIRCVDECGLPPLRMPSAV
jgi:hypothetical protein